MQQAYWFLTIFIVLLYYQNPLPEREADNMKKRIILIIAAIVAILMFWALPIPLLPYILRRGIIPLVIVAAMVVILIKWSKEDGGSIKGFFAPNAVCAICGKKIGLNRFKIGNTTDGKPIWKCAACAKKGGLINIDYATGKVTLIDNKDTEVRMKCNACGHVYCYTYADVEKNAAIAKSAALDSIASVGEALGGTRIGAYTASANADRQSSMIVDFSKCPHCHSTDVIRLSKSEWQTENAPQTQIPSPAASAPDEIKKYKDLLDGGAITQEEFDAKKKQLLGL